MTTADAVTPPRCAGPPGRVPRCCSAASLTPTRWARIGDRRCPKRRCATSSAAPAGTSRRWSLPPCPANWTARKSKWRSGICARNGAKYPRGTNRVVASLSFHSFDPLSPRRPGLEWIAEVLGLVDHLATLEFHDADHVIRLPVIRHDKLADPKIAAAKRASHGEAFDVRLRSAGCLDVGSASDPLARLWIVENCISPVDLVLRRKVVRVGGIPVSPQGDLHVVVTHGYPSLTACSRAHR